MANWSESLQPMKHDDYMTPKYVWEHIQHLIPKDKVIWEPFYGDGTSGTHLRELGFEVIHKPIDFFENNLGDIIVSNPPFSKSKQVMAQLKKLDKPFIMILPAQKINTSYVRENYKNTELQIIIPRKRIHFLKLVDGKLVEGWKNQTSFDCFYYCYKMNFPKDIIWLE
jgi:hypothetical protein